MTDARNFLLNSDYPIDKIAGSITGSVTVAGSGGTQTVTTAHSIGVAPLCITKWSTTSDFSISYEENQTAVSILGVTTTTYSDTSNIVIAFVNGSTTDRTLYYRIYYFIPYDADIDVSATNSSYDTYVLNTDYNYCKVALEGRTSSNSETITHSLGYYPQVEVWKYAVSGGTSGRYYHVVYGDNIGTAYYASQTTTTLVLYSSSAADRFYYKVYADEN